MTIKSLEQERLLNQGCSREEKMSRIGTGSNFREGQGYPHTRRLAAVETGLPLTTFPETCPWAGEQVLDEDFWPEMAGDGA